MTDLVTIGRFGALTGLSTKALRLYHELGLLPAAEVDPDTGYRRYRPDQARRARLLRILRSAGFSLAEIGELLREQDPEVVRARMASRRAELDRELRERERALARLDRFYGGVTGFGGLFDGDGAILVAAEARDVEAVAGLLADDPSLVNAMDVYDKTPLHLAAEHDHRRLAELLLDAGAELEPETGWGMTPLQWAANMGSSEVGQLLLSRGAQLNLWAAAGLGLLVRVRAFWDGDGRLEPGAAQTRYEEQDDGRWARVPPPDDELAAISDAFYVAARNGHTEVARFLLDRGADIDFRGFFGAPGLHWAAINGHADTVRFLLDQGADPALRDDEFDADALGWAREGEHEDVVRVLSGG